MACSCRVHTSPTYYGVLPSSIAPIVLDGVWPSSTSFWDLFWQQATVCSRMQGAWVSLCTTVRRDRRLETIWHDIQVSFLALRWHMVPMGVFDT